jgi:hypothetical protein
MATTTNYSWTTPDDTDLVKDGAAAIRTLGSSIDTSVKALSPGTTAGDVDYYTTSTAKARLGIGTAGQILTVNSGATAPEWQSPVATSINQNYLLNGNFSVAQRGTSYTSTGSANNDDTYILDRWYILSDGNDAIDVTQDTTTVPTNGNYAIALDVETVNKKFGIAQIIENRNCIGLIGNTVTFSFKAKVSSTTKLDNVKAAIVAWSGTADTVTSDIISTWNAEGTDPTLIANATYENTPVNLNLTTDYQTFSLTANIDTASTKNVIVFIWSDVTDTTLGDFLYIAESKVELGSTATAFVYANGNFAGELSACQRYYQRVQRDGDRFAGAFMINTTSSRGLFINKTQMRVAATAIEFSGLGFDQPGLAIGTLGTLTLSFAGLTAQQVAGTTGSSLAAHQSVWWYIRDAGGYFAVTAEL